MILQTNEGLVFGVSMHGQLLHGHTMAEVGEEKMIQGCNFLITMALMP
jgi:hypothetical protein